MATFHLQIVTPDRECYNGEAESVILRSSYGDVCILAHHVDYATPIGIGEAKIKDANGNVRKAACSGGLLGVCKGEVRVMATTFEWNDEIDVKRAEHAKEIAEERMKKLDRDDAEYIIAQAKLKRAIARISVAD